MAPTATVSPCIASGRASTTAKTTRSQGIRVRIRGPTRKSTIIPWCSPTRRATRLRLAVVASCRPTARPARSPSPEPIRRARSSPALRCTTSSRGSRPDSAYNSYALPIVSGREGMSSVVFSFLRSSALTSSNVRQPRGEAGAFPNSCVAISRWFPAGERGRAFGVLSMAMQTGGALSPLLVVPIQAHYGWRASFYVFALVGVVWAVVWFILFRNTPREKRGVTSSELNEIGDAPERHEHGLPWGVAVRSGNFWPILLMGLSYGYGKYFFLAWLPTYLVRARNFSERDLLLSSLPFIFGACANVGSGVTCDFLLKRFGLKVARCRVGRIGLACGGLFALLAAVTSSKYGTLLLLCLSFAGICFDEPMNFLTCIDVARKFPGSMAGAYNTAAYGGSFLSGVVFGYVAKIFDSYDLPLILTAFVLGFGALMWLKIDPTQELIPEDHALLAKA